jgi:peptide chain release factor 2
VTYQPGSSVFGTLFDIPAKTARKTELEKKMSCPGFWDDAESARRIVAELKTLKAIIEPVNELVGKAEDCNVLLELLAEEPDEQARRDLSVEIVSLGGSLERVELMTLLSGENDAANCYFNIQAGMGGADAFDFAEMLYRMYLRYFERNGYQAKELSLKPGEEAGIQSANLFVTGPYAYGILSAEMGVHRMLRISPYNAQGKRQTSFASVDVLPEAEDIQIELDWDKDVREDTYRASGAGGQHVNKTSSAVRLTHLPTNLVVQCQNERSQHKNRAFARKMLMARLYRLEEQKRDAELAKLYSEKGEIAWGNQMRSYCLYGTQYVKDHRTNVSSPNPQAVLDGELKPFIEAELRRRAGQRIG